MLHAHPATSTAQIVSVKVDVLMLAAGGRPEEDTSIVHWQGSQSRSGNTPDRLISGMASGCLHPMSALWRSDCGQHANYDL